jgi:hypothetical protein
LASATSGTRGSRPKAGTRKDYFIVESDTLENNPKIARGAAAIGVPVVDLVDLALTL